MRFATRTRITSKWKSTMTRSGSDCSFGMMAGHRPGSACDGWPRGALRHSCHARARLGHRRKAENPEQAQCRHRVGADHHGRRSALPAKRIARKRQVWSHETDARELYFLVGAACVATGFTFTEAT